MKQWKKVRIREKRGSASIFCFSTLHVFFLVRLFSHDALSLLIVEVLQISQIFSGYYTQVYAQKTFFLVYCHGGWLLPGLCVACFTGISDIRCLSIAYPGVLF